MKMDMLILYYTNRYNFNASCYVLCVSLLERSAKH